VNYKAFSVPAHRATTAHLCGAFPFVSNPPPLSGGVYIGEDLTGVPFGFDPFLAYAQQLVTNPNLFVVGQIGRGKSALLKTLLWRHAAFGHRGIVLDPKGEYGALCSSWGGTLISLRPGGHLRLNPLEFDPKRTLVALVRVCSKRNLRPCERAALDVAIDEATYRAGSERPGGFATLGSVLEALLEPSDRAASELRCTKSQLAQDGRDIALDLRRTVKGDLAGMLDGPTSPGLSLESDLVVFDLSALHHSEALGMLMVCVLAWLDARVSGRRPAGSSPLFEEGRTAPGALVAGEGANSAPGALIVIDEAWALLKEPGLADWLQASFKLARAWGVSNVVATHRFSDLTGSAPGGVSGLSKDERLALGLLADAETRVIYAQPPSETELARELLGLSEPEARLLPRLGRGVALWKIGSYSTVVRHRLSRQEQLLVDTDQAFRVPEGRSNP